MLKKILIILTVLLISGCGTFSGNKGPISGVNVHTGTNGLEMEFLKESPPNEVYENQIFKASIFLQNDGAADIDESYLLIAVEKDYMELLYEYSQRVDIQLKGKSLEDPVGEEKIEDFVIKAKTIEPQREMHDTSLYVTSCYKYRTELSETVCIDTDIYNIKPIEKVCEAKDISLSSQGAPVAVIRIENRISPSENGEIIIPEFVIYIRNKGKGEVIDINKISGVCSSEPIEREDINTLKVQAYLSGIPLECYPRELKLRNKEDKIICSLREGVKNNEPNFTTLLNVILDYGYTQTISEKVTIKKINI